MKTYVKKLRTKPLFLSFKAIRGNMPFIPVDLGLLYFIEYTGIPPSTDNYRFDGVIRWATANDLTALEICNPKRETFTARFNQGDHCVIAKDNSGNIVGYEWFSVNRFHVESHYYHKIMIPTDSIYAYDAFILPEYRIRGLWLGFKNRVGELMTRFNRSRLITFVEFGNSMSFKTHFRYGFKLYRRVLIIRILGVAISFDKILNHKTEYVKKLVG